MAAAQPQLQLLYTILPAHEHRQEGHVERPERVDAVVAALAAAGLLDGAGAAAAPPPAPAPLAELAALHSYVGELAARAAALAHGAPAVAVADADDEDGATYMTAASFDAARASAGAAAALVEAVLAPRAGGGNVPPPVGFSLARPPGHHATSGAPMGEFSGFLE
jgi:acetoin utilization deacetylase AcuC-like enzyme